MHHLLRHSKVSNNFSLISLFSTLFFIYLDKKKIEKIKEKKDLD
jgi:hypothetical protein